MLCAELEQQIERQQKLALKLIYGFDFKYDELLGKAGILTLKARREAACIGFAFKLSKSKRYASWLPLHEVQGPTLRRRNIYEEFNSRTSRLFNSPLFYLRRILNLENK